MQYGVHSWEMLVTYITTIHLSVVDTKMFTVMQKGGHAFEFTMYKGIYNI